MTKEKEGKEQQQSHDNKLDIIVKPPRERLS